MPFIIATEDQYEDRQYWRGPYSLPAWGRNPRHAEEFLTTSDADKAAQDWGITNYTLKETPKSMTTTHTPDLSLPYSVHYGTNIRDRFDDIVASVQGPRPIGNVEASLAAHERDEALRHALAVALGALDETAMGCATAHKEANARYGDGWRENVARSAIAEGRRILSESAA